jgi:hypothetical protein
MNSSARPFAVVSGASTGIGYELARVSTLDRPSGRHSGEPACSRVNASGERT